MKTLFLIPLFTLMSLCSFAQNQRTVTEAQQIVVQPNNTNPNPQRPVVNQTVQQPTQPQQVTVPSPQNALPAQPTNATYQDNAQFYNKDNTPVNNQTNSIPASNGTYSQPGYSNPNNKPSEQYK